MHNSPFHYFLCLEFRHKKDPVPQNRVFNMIRITLFVCVQILESFFSFFARSYSYRFLNR